jgi:hypothetical protein
MTIPTRIDSERGCGWRKPGGMYLVTGSAFTGCERMPLALERCPTCNHGVKPSRGWTWVDGDKLFASQPCVHAGENVSMAAGHCVSCLICFAAMHRVRPCPHCLHDTQHTAEAVYCTEQPQAGALATKENCNCDRTSVDGFYAPGMGRVGLLWVGGKYYPTPDSFTEEAARLGISRRLAQIPREFVVGETIVLMAHRKAIPGRRPDSPLNDGTYSPGVFMVMRPTAIEYVVKGDESEKKLASLVKRGITPVHVKRLERQTSMFEDAATVPTNYDVAAP